MNEREVPIVLRERLLVDDVDRKILNAANELSPKNNGRFFLTSSLLDNYVPSFEQIAKKSGYEVEEVKKRFYKISELWGLPSPENLPKNNGYYSNEEALVNALVNQHRLRWNPGINNYNVTRMHWLSGEMGTGTLYTNNEAFLGEKIVRQALGVDDRLVSYQMQGGVMPDIVTLFGKAKNKRAIMTGLNKVKNNVDENELELIIQKTNLLLDELKKPKLSEKAIRNLSKYVLNTIDYMEEGAESVAYELSDLVKNLKPFSELHLYWSYNDDYNQSEIEDKNIALLMKIHKGMEEALEKIPDLRENLELLEETAVPDKINSEIANRYYEFLLQKRNDLGKKFAERGEDFRKYTKEFFENRKGEKRAILKKDILKVLGAIPSDFDYEFGEGCNAFYDKYTTMKQVSNRREQINKNAAKSIKAFEKAKKELERLSAFENSYLAEKYGGPAWFTKKIAITPTEAKSLEIIKKEMYKDLYDQVLIPAIKKYSGRDDLQIFLHTDDMICVEVPDPQDSIEGRKDDENRHIGTIFASIPRTNSQWSNEPLLISFAKVQGLHEGEISKAVASGHKKPKTKKDFDKRALADANFVLSSWGADGYLSQYKFRVDPTTIFGEYAKDSNIVGYIKIPTRHDLHKLSELMFRGNKGTWAGKRLAKGGTVSGSDLLIEHADGTIEEIFFDDTYFKKVANMEVDFYGKKIILGEEYNDLEKKILETKNKKNIVALENQRQILLEKARPQIGRLFLQNDLHVGSYSTPGRPSNLDTITSSQLAALQTYGINGFQMSLMSEALHCELVFRSYDSKRESASNDDLTYSTDPVTFMLRLNLLESKMRKQGASDKQIIEAMKLYVEEFENSLSIFKPEDQLNMFDEIVVPANIELMENGVPLFLGTGNHWMGKRSNQSEASVISGRFDKKYQKQKILLMGQGAAGQSFSYDYFKLPSLDGKGINAVFPHRMWHGATEVDQISNQAVRTRSDAVYYITADKHHPGSIAEKGKMAVLDAGKQSTIPYAKMIGKAASINGTIVMGYGMNRELILSTRYFANPVIEKISGWDYKAGILSRARSLIIEAANDDSVLREARKINFLKSKSDKKLGNLEARLKH